MLAGDVVGRALRHLRERQGHAADGEQALEPQGASKPAWEPVADVATALGYEPSWTKLKQIRAKLAGGAAADATRRAPAAHTARGVTR